MATNRTATTAWRQVRDLVRAEAQDRGQTNCPLCNVWLDWDRSRTPNSVEIDHIMPASRGGGDDPSGLRAVCRKCNQQMGGALSRRKPKPITETIELDASPIW
jgi:5-methylcytosine-specific restriction endonuclease McrA